MKNAFGPGDGSVVVDTPWHYLSHHNPFQYYPSWFSNVEAGRIRDASDFFEDAKAGKLPNVSFIKATGARDEHPANSAPRWGEELPAPFNVPEVIEGQTVRQIARISVGGDQLRIVLSNEFGTRPVTIGNTTVALSAGGDAIDPETVKPVTFGGSATAVIPPGAPLVSDPEIGRAHV